MKNVIALRVVPVLLASLLAACDDPQPSSSIPTHELYADFVAETDADGKSVVRADFMRQQSLIDGSVYLDGGDTLVVRTQETHLVFSGGGNHFIGELLSGIEEGTRFEFDLQRPDHVDAPGSQGTLPAPMDIVLPEPGAEFSISSDELAVAWQWGGTTDAMWITVSTHCAGRPDDREHSFTEEVPGDPGAFAIDLSAHAYGDCRRYDGTVTLYRARAGTVDRAYAPDEAQCEQDSCRDRGSVSVRQVRSVPIVLTP